MRILFLIGTLDVGGAERQLVELATRLRPEFEPVILCLSATRGPLAKTLEQAGVRVEAVGMPAVRNKRGLQRLSAASSTPAALMRLVSTIRRYRPDVIHGFLFHGYILATMAGRLAGVPVVVGSRRSLSNFKRDRPMLQTLERRVNDRTDLIIANSEAVRQDVLHTEGVPADKVIVIYNGLETARYAAAPHNEALRRDLVGKDGPVALVVANFIAYKGHRYFLEAWARVVAAHPRAVALFAGDGAERAGCEMLANDLGLAERVRFLGTRSDVPALLKAADLLVHPSLEEGFCNAIVEAMAAGLPVVATNVGGNPEAVIEGETGYLVPPRDVTALSEGMISVWHRPDGGRSLGAAGAARVQAQFDMERMVTAYKTVYADLLARKEGSADVRNRRPH